MDIIAALTGLLTGAVAASQVARWRAAAQASRRRVQAQLDARVRHWQDEAERAKATAAQVSEQTAAWAAGYQQGREEVLSLARSLGQRGIWPGDDPAAG
jgi:hypothetical protein